jgi:hypothetical protein
VFICVNLYCKQTFIGYLKCAKEPKIWLIFIKMCCYWGVNAQSWNVKTRKISLMPLPFKSCLCSEGGHLLPFTQMVIFQSDCTLDSLARKIIQCLKYYYIATNYLFWLNIIHRYDKRHNIIIIILMINSDTVPYTLHLPSQQMWNKWTWQKVRHTK